jgi:hypothetical protein
MDWIFILIAVLIIVGNINKKKQKQAQEEARRRAMQQQAAGQGGRPQSYDMPYTPPPSSMEGMPADPRFPDYAPSQGGYAPAPQADPRFPDYAPAQGGYAPAQRETPPRPATAAAKYTAQQWQAPPPQPRPQQQAQPRVQQCMGEGAGTSVPRASASVRTHGTTCRRSWAAAIRWRPAASPATPIPKPA